MSVLEGEGSCCDCCLSNDAEVLKDVHEDLSRCRGGGGGGGWMRGEIRQTHLKL